jgi:sulfite reductase (NADPH) hemoprotein beta-component
VDAYLVDVVLGENGPQPRHFRERLRTLGPSIRRDLGKQARSVIKAQGGPHVSL